jgi:hypothetical protein
MDVIKMKNMNSTIEIKKSDIITCSCGAVGKSSYINSQKHIKTKKHMNIDKICKTQWKLLSMKERDQYGMDFKTCKFCSNKIVPHLKHVGGDFEGCDEGCDEGGDYECIDCNKPIVILYLCHRCKWNGKKYIFNDDDSDIEDN